MTIEAYTAAFRAELEPLGVRVAHNVNPDMTLRITAFDGPAGNGWMRPANECTAEQGQADARRIAQKIQQRREEQLARVVESMRKDRSAWLAEIAALGPENETHREARELLTAELQSLGLSEAMAERGAGELLR